MNVRLLLPVLICLARAWMISGEFKKRWKLASTRIAELSADAKALIERMAASGSLPPASAGLFWPESASRWRYPRRRAASSGRGRAGRSRPGHRRVRGIAPRGR